MKEIRSSRSIAFIGMLGALSAVLMLISVPLPFAPGFLKFDIAELPALFAGFFLGPVGGVKILLKLVTQGTDTAFVGDLMNIAGSCTFVLPAAFIYKRHHNKRGAAQRITLRGAAAMSGIIPSQPSS